MIKYFLVGLLAAFLISLVLLVNSVGVSNERMLKLPAGGEFIPSPTPKYFLHRDITATVFWVGEEESFDNNYISNKESVWDRHWLNNFGGVDDPDFRDGFFPQGFVPAENPFYVALPYTDFEDGRRKENVAVVPWYSSDTDSNTSIVKNHWVKVTFNEKTCFAQWEDAGPGETDDTAYVFGKASPANNFGKKAGIDVSPALRDCLGMGDLARVDWQFVDEEDVPEGPWKRIVTRSGINY